MEAYANETDATLVFQKSEVQKWQAEAVDIYARAHARADGCTLDPLFAREGNGEQLYRSLVEATCIRLFHARLIERALVDFANMQDGWRAIHEADIPPRKSRRKADCLAINERTGQLFVFEAKRDTRHYSAEAGRAIDDRLWEIVDALESRTRYLGWRYREVSVLVATGLLIISPTVAAESIAGTAGRSSGARKPTVALLRICAATPQAPGLSAPRRPSRSASPYRGRCWLRSVGGRLAYRIVASYSGNAVTACDTAKITIVSKAQRNT
ncbi:nuclease-related domain-containing protein [Azospirillum sp. 11R-A]|uniref:nuclease-related domain-containing protein n=1 Tax=Azospirillum sp. 11R-A TaxID=3111634 RepID=UPI003C1A8CC1